MWKYTYYRSLSGGECKSKGVPNVCYFLEKGSHTYIDSQEHKAKEFGKNPITELAFISTGERGDFWTSGNNENPLLWNKINAYNTSIYDQSVNPLDFNEATNGTEQQIFIGAKILPFHPLPNISLNVPPVASPFVPDLPPVFYKPKW